MMCMYVCMNDGMGCDEQTPAACTYEKHFYDDCKVCVRFFLTVISVYPIFRRSFVQYYLLSSGLDPTFLLCHVQERKEKKRKEKDFWT